MKTKCSLTGFFPIKERGEVGQAQRISALQLCFQSGHQGFSTCGVVSKAEQHVFFPIIHSYAGCGEGGLCLSGTCCEHRSRSCAASLVMKLMSEASVFPCAQISHRVINHIPSSPFPQTAHSYGQ